MKDQCLSLYDHPPGNWSWKSSACVCTRAGKMMRLPCLCVYRNMSHMTVIVPPHPTAPRSEQWWKCSDYVQNERWWGCASEWHFAHWVRKWVKFRVGKWGSGPRATSGVVGWSSRSFPADFFFRFLSTKMGVECLWIYRNIVNFSRGAMWTTQFLNDYHKWMVGIPFYCDDLWMVYGYWLYHII